MISISLKASLINLLLFHNNNRKGLSDETSRRKSKAGGFPLGHVAASWKERCWLGIQKQ